MGKIIEFNSEHDLDIGTILWAVGEKDVRKYKPCPACNNERTIKVTDSNGNEYDMPCPRCTGQQTKGGAFEDFKHYKAVAYRILGFELSNRFSATPEQKITMTGVGNNGEHGNFPLDIMDSENLTAGKTQYYISEDEAKAEAKRLNAEQAAAIKEFLEGQK